MKIQIGGLSEGIHRYRFEVEAPMLELGEQFTQDVTVDVTLDKGPAQILLHSVIETRAHFTCDRCVTEYAALLRPSYSMVYVTEGADTTDLDPDEIQVVPSGLSVIDIADDVRQTLLLSVPLKLLCKDACKGLCPHCGQNLNESSCECQEEEMDVRWEALRRFKSN